MIGYYVHHQGRGHLHRAEAILAALDEPATVLSSLPRPSHWAGEWVQLDRDDAREPHEGDDPTAAGALHWVPLHDGGLQRRMSDVVAWIADARPSAFVVDLSVEVAVQARLCGVPVVTTALPGDRRDRAHQLCLDLAESIIAPWQPLDPAMSRGLERHAAKVCHVGGISRFDGRPRTVPPTSDASDASSAISSVLRLGGTGGDGAGAAEGSTVDTTTPGWAWTHRFAGNWIDDPWPELCVTDVVVTHCGLGAVADVAAAGRPGVFLAGVRPHGEQASTAAGLAAAGLGIVLDAEPRAEQWPAVLERAARLDTSRWHRWSDGRGAQRAADVISRAARARR